MRLGKLVKQGVYTVLAIENENSIQGWGSEMRIGDSFGTNLTSAVSNVQTAHPAVSKGQRWSATPIPSPGGKQ
jgi:hypothetical protein